MDYLFLDTFALAQLTKSHYDLLVVFLKKHQLYLVISTVQLMEYYSPILEANDRTDRAVHLLTEHPFVIADVHDIFNKEEENYPAILKELPFRLNSTDVLDHHSAEEKSQILFQMLHHGYQKPVTICLNGH